MKINFPMPNMNSPIIPRQSAAGFELNTHVDDIFEDKENIPLWNELTGSLPDVVLRTDHWIRFSPNFSNELNTDTGDQFYFNKGALQLIFNRENFLKCIALSDGYHGMLFEKISIGTRLGDVLKFFEIKYDQNDEVHYPADEESYPGIEFYAEGCSLAESPEQVISAIFVKI
ncbi:hypothetical protein [Duganella sp. HH101]|uniref:hypothetical protein n=1 Tax=Duganella sp. HH101 TaxID=1781066 RepID=UPI00114CAE0C|nr:hypothetical protein [Duganella sp. HH101]